MNTLYPCRFCGDEDAAIKSGPCEYASGKQFMAQVHCGHCGAAGTRYAGEDTEEIAALRATKAWNDASEQPRSFTVRMIDTSNFMIILSLCFIIFQYTQLDGALTATAFGFLLGTVILSIWARLSVWRKRQRGQSDYWDTLTEMLTSATD